MTSRKSLVPLEPPSYTTTQRNNLSSVATGALIFNSTTGQYERYTGAAWRGITEIGGTDVALADGGTGASDAATAAQNLLVTPSDGWIADTDTWVYVSATSFKIQNFDRTAKFKKGTRVSYNDGSVDYGECSADSAMSGSDTLVTLVANADYAIANATLTAPRFSYAACPPGYPMWRVFASTLTGWSSNPTGTVYKYSMVGNLMVVNWRQVTNGTSNASTKTASLPVAAATIGNQAWITWGLATDNGVLQQLLGTIGSAATTITWQVGLGNVWTASGNCKINGFQIAYEV